MIGFKVYRKDEDSEFLLGLHEDGLYRFGQNYTSADIRISLRWFRDECFPMLDHYVHGFAMFDNLEHAKEYLKTLHNDTYKLVIVRVEYDSILRRLIMPETNIPMMHVVCIKPLKIVYENSNASQLEPLSISMPSGV